MSSSYDHRSRSRSHRPHNQKHNSKEGRHRGQASCRQVTRENTQNVEATQASSRSSQDQFAGIPATRLSIIICALRHISLGGNSRNASRSQPVHYYANGGYIPEHEQAYEGEEYQHPKGKIRIFQGWTYKVAHGAPSGPVVLDIRTYAKAEVIWLIQNNIGPSGASKSSAAIERSLIFSSTDGRSSCPIHSVVEKACFHNGSGGPSNHEIASGACRILSISCP